MVISHYSLAQKKPHIHYFVEKGILESLDLKRKKWDGEGVRWGAQMEAEKRRWGRKEEATGGMTAVCGRGICHILSGDRTSERYSIACAVLGSCKHTSTHTQDSRPNQAYLALHGCAASMQSSRSCRWRPGSFWTVSLNAMSLPVME